MREVAIARSTAPGEPAMLSPDAVPRAGVPGGSERASTMSIGDLSRATGVKATTIRWYEAEGWLPSPARTGGGHRVYGEPHLRRLGFIRHARELGFPMSAIRLLLDLADRPGADCGAAHAVAVAQIKEVDARVKRLLALRTELERMAATCAGGIVGECRILETLADFEHGHCADASHAQAGREKALG